MQRSGSNRKDDSMNTVHPESKARARMRNLGAALFSVAVGIAMTASAIAADTVTLRVGDQKGGNRSLLEIAGLAKDLPYKIEWSEFLPRRRSSKRSTPGRSTSATPEIWL